MIVVSYQELLPHVFPCLIVGDKRDMNFLLHVVLDVPISYAPNGTSFAITTDGYNIYNPDSVIVTENAWCLWLSKASFGYIMEHVGQDYLQYPAIVREKVRVLDPVLESVVKTITYIWKERPDVEEASF